jgi:hypothetical protein
LAISLKKNNLAHRVCFDSRGAYDAEFNEYNVASNERINQEIFSLEKRAVLDSDFRIAVSGKLLAYWKERYGYSLKNHVVIPCTLNTFNIESTGQQNNAEAMRKSMGYSDKDVVFVYAGSSAGWQSLKLIDEFLCDQMGRNDNARAMLLIKNGNSNMNVLRSYSGRVTVKWVAEEQVTDILSCCDYGLLIRESSVTNSVAAPVKFAEYLGAGLKVVISEGIGDYSEFVRKNNCGYVVDPLYKGSNLSRPTSDEKKYNSSLALKYFSKGKYLEEYTDVYNNMVK